MSERLITAISPGHTGVPKALHTARQETSDQEETVGHPSSSGSAMKISLSWQTAVVIAAALFLALGFLFSIWELARPIAILILGLSVAAALASPAKWLSRWIPRIASVILVHALVIVVLVAIGILIAPAVASQTQELINSLPNSVEWLTTQIERLGIQGWQPLAGTAMSSITDLGGELISLPMAVWNTALDIIVIFALSFYALLAAPAASRFIFSLFPKTRREEMQHVLRSIVDGMGGYLRGVFIMGIIVASVTYPGLRIIGVPYPLVLAVLAGMLEFIPVLGTTISVIAITAVAATQSITIGLITFAFLVTIQLIEGNILFPTIVGRETNSSPLLSMFAFFAGISVGGILGGIIAVPLAVALRVMFVQAIAPAIRRQTGASPT